MKILTVPQDTAMLRTKSSPIQEITPEIIKFLSELGDTLKNQHNPQGVGLSAIQVGRPIRVFATWLPRESKKHEAGSGKPDLAPRASRLELMFYLNPEILDHSPDTTIGEDLVEQTAHSSQQTASGDKPSAVSRKPFLEGCLSIPKIYGPVPRWSWIKAQATVLSESDVSSSRFPASPTGGSLHAFVPSSGLRLRDSDSRRSNDFTLEKLSSRVFQHELDHLNGILFTDRTLEAGLQLYESKEKELVPMEM